MSRPKNWWYPIALRVTKNYNKLFEKSSPAISIWLYALNKAIKDTEDSDNGKDKMKAITLVYFSKEYTIAGIAQELGYSEVTVKRWLSAFVNLVGKYAGY